MLSDKDAIAHLLDLNRAYNKAFAPVSSQNIEKWLRDLRAKVSTAITGCDPKPSEPDARVGADLIAETERLVDAAAERPPERVRAKTRRNREGLHRE